MSCPYQSNTINNNNSSAQKTETKEEYEQKVHKAKNEKDEIYYGNYLRLDELLELQQPLSRKENGQPAHEELLFITTHQTYELWFNQIHHEIASIIQLFQQSQVQDREMLLIINRMERSVEIMKILCAQFNILETMYPQDFLEFRESLTPASGFQSKQFRLLENRLGLKPELRMNYQQSNYTVFFSAEHKKELEKSHEESTLFDVVEKWLERTPFLQSAHFKFWDEYRDAIRKMLEKTEKEIRENPFNTEVEKEENLDAFKKNNASFAALLSESEYTKRFKDGSSKKNDDHPFF